MKPIAAVAVLLFLSITVFSQLQQVPVFCRLLENGKVEYGNLGLVRPLISDSAADVLFIQPRKQFHLDNLVDALQLMSLNGWRLAALEQNVSGSAGQIISGTTYLLTKDIYLDEKAKQLFADKLKGLGK